MVAVLGGLGRVPPDRELGCWGGVGGCCGERDASGSVRVVFCTVETAAAGSQGGSSV